MALQRLLLAAIATLMTVNCRIVSAEVLESYNLCENNVTLQNKYINATTGEFIVNSPLYGEGKYYPLQHCSLELRTLSEPLIVSFRIIHFDVEYHRFCGYDYLCLNGIKQCGYWSQNYTLDYFVPENSVFTIFFKSDHIGQASGFQIHVTVEPTGSRAIQEARSRVGDGLNTVYETVSYYQGYPYTDKCPTPPENTRPNDSTSAPINNQIAEHQFCNAGSNVLSVGQISKLLIHSPNYGSGLYPENSDCRTVLKTGDDPLLLTFRFSYFNVESNEECYADFFCMNGYHLCGNSQSPQIYKVFVPANSNFTLWWKTDDSVSGSGFEIEVTAKLAYNQSIDFNTMNFNPLSYMYPASTFSPNLHYNDACSLQVVNPYSMVNYTTSFVSTATPYATTIASFQTTTTTPFPTPTRWVTPSSGSNVYNLCDPSWSGVVALRPFSPAFVLQNINFGYWNYSNGLLCNVVLRSGPEPLILPFSYNAFNLEQHNSCNYDSLCVNGIKFCGSWAAGRTFHNILPPYSDMTVQFRTDNSVTMSGFKIFIAPEFAVDQTVQQIETGIGSNPSNLVMRLTSYYTGYPYTDRCVAPSTTTTPSLTTATRINTTGSPNVWYFCEPTNYFDLNILSSPFVLRSPIFGTYQPTNCNVVFVTRGHPLVLTLSYRRLNLDHCNCECDYLCANGVRFCYNRLSGYVFQYIIPQNSTFTLSFFTDGALMAGALEIEVSFEWAYNRWIYEAVSGVGIQYDNLVFRNTSYPLSQPYVDRCPLQQPNPSTSTTYNPWTTSSIQGIPDTTANPSSCGQSLQELDQALRLAESYLASARRVMESINYNGDFK